VSGFLSAVALAKAVSRTGRGEFAHNRNGYVGSLLEIRLFGVVLCGRTARSQSDSRGRTADQPAKLSYDFW